MLDNANILKQRDPQNYLGFVGMQPEQLAHDFGVSTTHFSGYRPIENVVFVGMGGSAQVAELATTWPNLSVPFVIWRDYGLPQFVNRNTLVICSSYSGNTEETLSALERAKEVGAYIAVIAHGGKLKDLAKKRGYVLAEVPLCPQPRVAIFYEYRALVELLIAAGLAPNHDIKDLVDLVVPLQQAVEEWEADVPTAKNPAKRLAEHLVGKTLVVYAGPLMYPAALKWKMGANENAKNTAWVGRYPDFNHTEFIGWSSHPVEKPFAVIDLMSHFEHTRTQKRMVLSDRMLSGLRPKAIQLQAPGSSALEHMLHYVLLGDFVTSYLAVLNGVNPTPVALVEKFKKELN